MDLQRILLMACFSWVQLLPKLRFSTSWGEMGLDRKRKMRQAVPKKQMDKKSGVPEEVGGGGGGGDCSQRLLETWTPMGGQDQHYGELRRMLKKRCRRGFSDSYVWSILVLEIRKDDPSGRDQAVLVLGRWRKVGVVNRLAVVNRMVIMRQKRK